MKYFCTVFCGALFGLGLAISQMTSPQKVVGFLNVTGDWDPSLLLVLGGAVVVTAIAFRFVPRLKRPVFDRSFEESPAGPIDGHLVAGAAIFGIGWGLAGFCPGPGIVSLARLAPDAFIFVGTFLVGSWVFRLAFADRTGQSQARSRA